jgi:ATP-dependent 26S proteasome regulatory subunit
MNVIALFTTNHLEKIDPTFLRGKRIGTIISMTFLDAQTAQLYINKFCEDVTLEGDFGPICELIEDSKIAPAFMAEIIENVKSNMIIREETSIKADHFKVCIESYVRQVTLSQTKSQALSPEEVLAKGLKDVLLDAGYFDKVDGIVYDATNR